MEKDILSEIWPEWSVERKIGKGAYGVVYEAKRTDHAVESKAAIKVITIPENESELASLRAEGLSEDDTKKYLEGIVNDFVKEIQLMESFKGVQNIVSVEDYKVVEKTGKSEIGWTIYIRMELLTPFNDYLADKTLTEKEVIQLGIDICSALELCARQKVIHRDIKPENIFVNQFGSYKLGDFGIARKLENVTGGMSQKGTYNYMAPEVEKGGQYDLTVDLYSLGLVLYRLLNHNLLPFLSSENQLSPNGRMEAVRKRMDGAELPPPEEASEAMAQVILKACSYEPSGRYQSASEMKQALERVTAGEPSEEEDI
ncbi:MAG: serine/threonine protein kinase [Lachnospiraceae bacterium]|nr:serine/threonine protein kinase [Lachnospiraceae bacterium]